MVVNEAQSKVQPTTLMEDRRSLFNQWKLTHGKSYELAEEEEKRFGIWNDNYDFVQQHNLDPEHTYKVGMNKFADLTNIEFSQSLSSCLLKNATKYEKKASFANVGALPTSVDWRTKGAVTPVKDQGQCGSCWAFGSTGALEGLHFLTKGSLVSFSEQQLVDCSRSFGNLGCSGGLENDAYNYVKQYGIEPESVYPYTAKNGKCSYSASQVVFKNTGYTEIAAQDNAGIAAAVANQPVNIGIEADQSVFQLYTSGVFNSKSCGTNIDHAVLAVGYGTDATQGDYWIIKNSWGTSWGEQGYIRMAKVSTKSPGVCGLALEALYPTVTASAKPQHSHSNENGEN
jgi:C1A family cysteine protease